jgi:hypothetical protein
VAGFLLEIKIQEGKTCSIFCGRLYDVCENITYPVRRQKKSQRDRRRERLRGRREGKYLQGPRKKRDKEISPKWKKNSAGSMSIRAQAFLPTAT